MCADVLTTWGVVLELDGIVDEERLESASRWFAQGRDAFFKRCPRLAAFLRAEKALLQVTAEQVGPIAPASCAGGLMVGVSVIEVRPSSFDMGVRIRPAGEDAGQPANGRCTMVIQRRATGERIPIPREIRDEFIATQLAARELC
jgi:acyl-CoA thioesterase FadM